MPFLPDGRPVDIVLNPLGVPSRMNIGQVLETHLGWVATLLGFYAKTPVFQGANEREIGMLLKLAALTWVRDAMQLGGTNFKMTDAEVRAILADLMPKTTAESLRVELLSGATLNDLGVKGRSAGTKAIFARARDFVVQATRDLVAREQAELDLELAFHTAAMEDEEYTALHRESFKAQLKDIEKRRSADATSLLRSLELPSLASTLESKDFDVDAAVTELIRFAGITPGGKVRLRDGRSGETFKSPVMVGTIYMLKLSHLVDDKIHARSIGPYSLVTQQPLAGKAQFGGQRFGEMEVWALEAYGAAHTLQEILTVKSDDVNGRSKVYEAIVKGQNLPEPGTPESFNVLVQELKALGIHVRMGANESGFAARMNAERDGLIAADGNGSGNGNGEQL
jgi:DNA-directed RNA polymerase subunit beta